MQGIIFETGALALFFVLALVLSRDDEPYGRCIRVAEIVLPAAAALAAYHAWQHLSDLNYFIALVCFVFALLYALTRRALDGAPYPFGMAGGGMAVFFYSIGVIAGSWFAVAAFLHFDPFLQ